MFDCDIVACLLPIVEPPAVADGLLMADGVAGLDGLAAAGAFGIVLGEAVLGEIGDVG
jgi:hypothetical protein